MDEQEHVLRDRLEALDRELNDEKLVTSYDRAEDLLREQEVLQQKLATATLVNR